MKKNRRHRLKPINVPAEVNCYDALLRLGDPDALQMRQAIHATFQHFQIPNNQYREVGNALIRFCLMMAINDKPLNIPAGKDWEWVHMLGDLYEYFNEQFDEPPNVFRIVPN